MAYRTPESIAQALKDIPEANFVGATVSTAGTSGYVPQPIAGDHVKFLRGDGTWAVPAGGGGGDMFKSVYDPNDDGIIAIAQGGTGAITASAARTALGLAINTDVQAYDAELAALAGLVSAADSLPYFTGVGTAALTTLTAFARSLLDDANNTAARATLGVAIGSDIQAWDTSLDSIAAIGLQGILVHTGAGVYAVRTLISSGGSIIFTDPSGIAGNIDIQVQPSALSLDNFAGTLSISKGGTGATTASAARTALGLAINTDVQAYDAELAALAGLVSAADSLPYFTGVGTAALTTLTSFGRSLVDDANAATARTTLGLGGLAVLSAVTEGEITLVDVTTNNFTTLKHGFVPKGTGVGNFLRDDGTWQSIPGGGDMLKSTYDPNNDGVIAIAQGGTGQITATTAFDALSPLTTKGDLVVRDATNNVRLPVGTNGHVLVADSTQSTGMKWAEVALTTVDNVGNTTTVTTTSTTDVLVTGMTATPNAGTYLVMFSTTGSNATSAATVEISLYGAGTRLANTARVGKAASGNQGSGVQFGLATQAIITVNGSQAIEARWKVSGGTGSLYTKSMTLVKVGG